MSVLIYHIFRNENSFEKRNQERLSYDEYTQLTYFFLWNKHGNAKRTVIVNSAHIFKRKSYN